MTLNLTIVNPWGVWQSSDLRLTNRKTREIEDDFSLKQIVLRCSDGSALVAYAGIGRMHPVKPVELKNGVEVSDWVRESLRGAQVGMIDSLVLLRENATRDLARGMFAADSHHMFTAGAFVAGTPWIFQIRNFHVTVPGRYGPLLDHFISAGEEMKGEHPWKVCAFGDQRLFDAKWTAEWAKLRTVAALKHHGVESARKAREVRLLLAAINKRAAARYCTISPHCVTTYMPPSGEPFDSEFHDAKQAPKPLVIPMLLFGIDLTEIERATIAAVSALDAATDPVSEEATKKAFQEGAEKAAKNAYVRRNRLRS